MKRITVYTPEELKRKNPDAFEKAKDRYNPNYGEIPWQGEIMDSLKAIFKASGIALRDWSIDGNYPSSSYVRIDFSGYYESDTESLAGPRAMAWLENNLLGDLRIKANSKDYMSYNNHYTDKSLRPYSIGKIKTCPFTGYFADDDFIESLIKDIKAGETLGEAYHNLAQVAGRMFESEIEYVNSEEYFLEQEHLQFTIDGRLV